MANSDTTKTAVDQSRASYADDAKARRVLLVDETGNVVGQASHTRSTVYVNSLIVQASAGEVIEVRGYNSGPDQFLHIFDSATVPANGTTPLESYRIFADDNYFWEPKKGVKFSTVIVITNSTTDPTKTIGAADISIFADFI